MGGKEWSAVQMQGAENICKYIVSKYPVKFITDHSSISPGRKIDVQGSTGNVIDVFPRSDFVKITGLKEPR
jgi:hypothetical protein